MWVMGVTLVMVVMFSNLLLMRYAQAVVRQATDEGARAWAISGGSQDDCIAEVYQVMGDLLGGTLARDLQVDCRDNGLTVSARARITLAGMPPVPDSEFETTSIVTKELENGRSDS